MTSHAQITQNNKFSIPLQYLEREVSDEVVFLHGNKDETYLQIDTMSFHEDGQVFPRSTK